MVITVRTLGGSSLVDVTGAGGSATSHGDIWFRDEFVWVLLFTIKLWLLVADEDLVTGWFPVKAVS